MSEVRKIKPSLSKGTRDFLPAEVARRNYIFNTIKSVFRKYGFEEIETPAIERLETLTGKYGEEGDKLLFKILNSGNPFLQFLPKELELIQQSIWRHFDIPQSPPIFPFDDVKASDFPLDVSSIVQKTTDKGLRYDLTVPLSRYVVQHQSDLPFPFKRFHIGPVWRADRPQKGRYQEFYQCDADVIGSDSLLNEVELTKIYLEVFEKLGVKVKVQLNHRQIFKGITSYFGIYDDNEIEIFINQLDKLDKIGIEKVVEAINNFIKVQHPLEEITATSLRRFRENTYIDSNNWEEIIDKLQRAVLGNNKFQVELWNKTISNIYEVLKNFKFEGAVKLNTFLARGLTYYTGVIWEVVLDYDFDANKSITMGSLGGGGRYENLTEIFGGKNMSGVGISFGIERIYDVMEELKLFPDTILSGVKVLFVPRDNDAEKFTFEQVQTLRDVGISAEIFLGNVKNQKHFDYVAKKNIAYLVEVGENEVKSKKFRLRNAKTRETQNDLSLQEIIEIFTED